MGNREELLDGAKRCLREKGYARTTVRDIAAAAGVSMAAIGYHYGSKEALLNAALVDLTRQWAEDVGRAVRTAAEPGAEQGAQEAGPVERFEKVWTSVIESFADSRPLWSATFEVLGHLDRVPPLRELLTAGQREARPGLAEILHGVDQDNQDTSAIGSFYQALLTGVMAQYLIDPDHAPSGVDLAHALRVIAAETR